MKKTAQQIQDEIFRKMSVDRRIRLGSLYWHLAKIIYGVDRIYKNTEDVHMIMKTIVDKINLYYLRKWATK